MLAILAGTTVALYVTTCWYSLRRNDQKLRARKAHPCRKTRKK
jgi:hypothetical protein